MSTRGNPIKSVVLCLTMLFLTVLIFPMIVQADNLSCQGSGQAFFHLESIQKETYAVPCVFRAETNVNISCVGMILISDHLISTTPPITDVPLFGRASTINIDSEENSTSFMVSFKNRDLLTFQEFTYRVLCHDLNGTPFIHEADITVEYPFAERYLDLPLAIGKRDPGQLVGIIISVIIIIIFLLLIWRKVL